MATAEGYLLSSSERLFIRQGISDDLRLDGRARLAFRQVVVEKDPVPQAAGSAKIRVGETEVLCSVKGDILEPSAGKPGQGRIVFSVDVASGAAIGQPREGDDRSARQEEAAVRAAFLHRLFLTSSPTLIDLDQLCIVSGRFAWSLSVDVLVLQGGGGNLADTMALAVHAALLSVRLPKVTVEEGEAVGLSLSDDPSDLQSLQCDALPLSVTFALFGGVGEAASFVIDPAAAEEAAADCLLSIGISGKGHIVMMRKHQSPLSLGTYGPLLLPTVEEILSLSKGLFAPLQRLIIDARGNNK